MNPRHLDHFLKIVQSGSLSRAADRLNLSQSMLSRELRELEDEMGVKLLQRHARGVLLTAAGEAFKKRGERILGLIDALPAEVREAAHEPAGSVNLGMPATMTTSVTTPLVRAYLNRHPGVKLRVTEGTGARLRAALLARELDLALLTAPVSEPQLIVRPLLVEPCVLVMPPDSPLIRRRRVTLNDLTGCRLIMPPPPNYMRALLDAAFEERGTSPDIVLETDDAPLMLQFVASGLGHAIMPACAVAPGRPAAAGMLRHVPIHGLTLTRLMATPAGVAMSLGTQRLSQMMYEQVQSLIKGQALVGEYVGP